MWNLGALLQGLVIMTFVMYGYQLFLFEFDPFEADWQA